MQDYDYQEEEPRRENRGDGPLFGLLSGLLSKPLNIAIFGFIAGVLFGWIILGWWVFPVEWQNASAQELREDLQIDYLRMVIDSYNYNIDLPRAKMRINELGDAAPKILDILAQNPDDELSQVALRTFQQLYSSGSGNITDDTADETTPADTTGGEDAASFPWGACLVLFGIAAALVGLYYLRGRSRGPSERTAAMRAQEFTRQATQTDYEALGEENPITQYMTTYLVGDDLYDDSFSIDSPNGEFMGECGVGIADTIGVGEPKRVSAFEVWLFDKNDLQTVTKVLMSSHIYNDESGHNRLAAKGEPFLANPGAEVILETATLQMVVRVKDMAYGSGALPENSFFDRLTLELAVWEKR